MASACFSLREDRLPKDRDALPREKLSSIAEDLRNSIATLRQHLTRRKYHES